MRDTTEAILAVREKTHGFFPDHAAVTQVLKELLYYPDISLPMSDEWMMSSTPRYERYDYVQREGLDMIAHKLGRIVAGNPNEPDHWADIAGYARLVADHLERMAKEMADHLERAKESEK